MSKEYSDQETTCQGACTACFQTVLNKPLFNLVQGVWLCDPCRTDFHEYSGELREFAVALNAYAEER